MAKSFLQNLTLYQGDDWAAMVNVTNCDGTPADLTGYTAQSEIRSGVADQTWVVAATLTCVILPPSQISISLTSLQTTLLRQPAYRWDLQVVSPAGIVTTIMAGQVNLLFEVTRTHEAPWGGWGEMVAPELVPEAVAIALPVDRRLR